MKVAIDQEKVLAIIARIETGESERSACNAEGMNRATFRAHALKFQAGDHYVRALAALAEQQIEQVEQAIQDMREGVIDPQMAKVEIDARKWFASKFLPKRYGDKVAHELTGENGGPIQVTKILLADLEDE